MLLKQVLYWHLSFHYVPSLWDYSAFETRHFIPATWVAVRISLRSNSTSALFSFLLSLHLFRISVFVDVWDSWRCKINSTTFDNHLQSSYFDWKALKANKGAHHFQAAKRLRGFENNRHIVCCFIDSWNISENCKLKLERVSEKDYVVGTSSQALFRLQTSRESNLQVCNCI